MDSPQKKRMSSGGNTNFVFKRQASPSVSERKNSSTSFAAADDTRNETDGSSNRLAPYNPTHASAQSAALDLLRLTSNDVFFDLGCGDGRLIVTALERCYDYDYLTRVHEERFERFHLQRQEEEQPLRRSQLCQPGGEQHQQHKHQQRRDHIHQRRNGSLRQLKIKHSRSTSTGYSVPHLVLMPLDNHSEDMSCQDFASIFVDHNLDRFAHHRRVTSNLSGIHSWGDLSLALSPPSNQTHGRQMCTPSSTSMSPEPPVACNPGGMLNLDGMAMDNVKHINLSLPAIPPADGAAYDDRTEGNKSMIDIPKTVETSSPDGESGRSSQILELPVIEADNYLSLLSDRVLATVHLGSNEQAEEPGWALGWPHGGNEVMHHATGGGYDDRPRLLMGGLRCVGVEYKQALAESAQLSISKSHISPYVEGRVCIRWGDVMDEWTRGQKETNANDHVGIIGAEGTDGNNVSCNNLSMPQDRQGLKERDASKLTLLHDATAVFVYLLPQGLKKVKPLLHRAAVYCQQRQEKTQQQRMQQQHQRHIQHQHHLLHLLQQQSFKRAEHSPSLASKERTPLALPQMLAHHKGSAHLCADYHMNCQTDSLELNEGCWMQKGTIEKKECVPSISHPSMPVNNNAGLILPSFRVVSYMFSIPGWIPTKVDRSSKAGCPLYLYENIHEEER